METFVIIKKNTGTNRVIETPVKSYMNRDNAVLNCAALNESESNEDTTYHLTAIPHSEAETIEAYREGMEVYLMDEDGVRVYIDVETDSTPHEIPRHESGVYDLVPDVSVSSIKINGTYYKDLKLSKELERDIEHQADNLCDYILEEIESEI